MYAQLMKTPKQPVYTATFDQKAEQLKTALEAELKTPVTLQEARDLIIADYLNQFTKTS
jgi:hypothetical protein